MVDVVQEVAEDLSTGIERSLSFLRTAGDAETIDRIVLSGGGSRFPGLAEFLKHRHDIEVEHADPLEGVEFDPEVFENHDVDRISPLLAVSVGLGMRTPGDKQ